MAISAWSSVNSWFEECPWDSGNSDQVVEDGRGRPGWIGHVAKVILCDVYGMAQLSHSLPMPVHVVDLTAKVRKGPCSTNLREPPSCSLR